MKYYLRGGGGRGEEEEMGEEGRDRGGRPKLVNKACPCNELQAEHWHLQFAIDLDISA